MENVLIKVPGKLYISGEYAVLTSARNACLVTVNKYLNVTVKKSEKGFFKDNKGQFSFHFDGSIIFEGDHLESVKAAIEQAYAFLTYHEVNPFLVTIEVTSELEHSDGRKYGLGSSAAVILGVIKGILKIHHQIVTDLQLFKLVTIAQKKINRLSSGGDAAALIKGGYVYYERYCEKWFNRQTLDIELVFKPWPKLSIESFEVNSFDLIVGWTGIVHDNQPFIEAFEMFIKKHPTYAFWYAKKMRKHSKKMKKYLIDGDIKQVDKSINNIQQTLDKLMQKSKIEIVSKPFKEMIALGKVHKISMKVSGAGYGDCGIGFIHKNQISQKESLKKALIKIGVYPLDVEIS